MKYILDTAPTSEPITLTEVKTHLRLSDTTFDTELATLQKAAREYVENYCNIVIMEATWLLKVDGIPTNRKIVIGRGSVTSIDEISYTDNAGSAQTLTADTDYITDGKQHPETVTILNTPDYDRDIPIIIEYTAGFDDAANVPASLKIAILMLTAFYFENRGDVAASVPFAIYNLLKPYRNQSF